MRNTLTTYVEKASTSKTLRALLLSLALLWVNGEVLAQTQEDQTKKDLIETVSDSIKTPDSVKEISLQDDINLGLGWKQLESAGKGTSEQPWIEPDLPDEDDSPKDSPEEPETTKKPAIDVHGMVRWGSDVTPLLWSVLSDKAALILSIDASNPQTGLWLSITRADDFDKSMDNPASQVTIFDFYWLKQIWKASVMVDWEYTTIDKLPGSDSFTPIAWCTYDAWKWWNLDIWAWHTFQKWEDGDVVRLWVAKKLNECLSLAAQGFYSSDLSKKFYGRVQADVKLGKWFGVQLSFIAKEWKITPTAWVIYKF